MLSSTGLGLRRLSVSNIITRGRAISPYSSEVIKKEMSPQDYSKMVEKGKKKAYYEPKTNDPYWKP